VAGWATRQIGNLCRCCCDANTTEERNGYRPRYSQMVSISYCARVSVSETALLQLDTLRTERELCPLGRGAHLVLVTLDRLHF
jgi:hypothetical protein